MPPRRKPLRLYRYRSGQRFAPHTDHWHQFDARTLTLHTVPGYLNDGFDGGETRFSGDIEQTIAPKTGCAALWQHKLTYEGLVVRSGLKYALRSDLIYGADTGVVTVDGGFPSGWRPSA